MIVHLIYAALRDSIFEKFSNVCHPQRNQEGSVHENTRRSGARKMHIRLVRMHAQCCLASMPGASVNVCNGARKSRM